MSDQSKAFLNAISDCEEQCQQIREALQRYSDKVAKGVDENCITHAIAWKNGLDSYRRLIEIVTKHGTEPEPAPECSIKPPAQQCSI